MLKIDCTINNMKKYWKNIVLDESDTEKVESHKDTIARIFNIYGVILIGQNEYIDFDKEDNPDYGNWFYSAVCLCTKKPKYWREE